MNLGRPFKAGIACQILIVRRVATIEFIRRYATETHANCLAPALKGRAKFSGRYAAVLRSGAKKLTQQQRRLSLLALVFLCKM